jgi:hypothetical protein
VLVAVNDAMISRYRYSWAKRVVLMKNTEIFGVGAPETNWNELIRDALVLEFLGYLKNDNYGDEEIKEVLHKLKR